MNNDILKLDELKTDEYVISYIDILGTSNRLTEDDKFLFKLRNIYRETIKLLKNKKEYSFCENISVKIFSDNIIACTKMIDIGSILKIEAFSLYFQLFALLAYNVILRGYITIGQLYIDDIFICGNALIDAYIGESQLAVYPRIIINKDIIKNYRSLSCVLDIDGEYFIDYYCSINKDELSNLKNTYNQWLSKYYNDEKILQKINWLITYHNKFCTMNGYFDLCINRDIKKDTKL